MIYLFTWNSRYLILQEVQKWKSAFTEKYGETEVTHITDIEKMREGELESLIFSRSLFSEKSLCIIDNFPSSWENSGLTAEKEMSMISKLWDVSEEKIVVLLSVNPDKRKSSYKELVKICEKKEFYAENDESVKNILRKKYGSSIDTNALERLVFLKWGSLEKSVSEVEKLRVLHSHVFLEHIENFVFPEFEESLFVFIDSLLTGQKTKALREIKNILHYSSFYGFYQSLIANLRVFLYISFLQSQKKSPAQIVDILSLWKRSFLAQKNISARPLQIEELYNGLLRLDKNMKTGKLLSSDEKDLVRELEREVLKFLA